MFRAPRLIDCGHDGDCRRYVWVMEPERGQIFGKAFMITNTELAQASTVSEVLEPKSKAAYEVMLQRSKLEYIFNVAEGSTWDHFA